MENKTVKILGNTYSIHENNGVENTCLLCAFGPSYCPFRGMHPSSDNYGKIDVECNSYCEINADLSFYGYFKKEPNYSLDNLPPHFLATFDNGLRCYGDNQSTSKDYLNRDIHKVVSLKEITFGEELIEQPIEYIVVDEEDNVVQEISSTKKLHLTTK